MLIVCVWKCSEPQAWIVGGTVTGALRRKAVYDAVLVAVVLPLDAGNRAQIGFHRVHQPAADSLVRLRRILAEQTSSVGVGLRKHTANDEALVESRLCPRGAQHTTRFRSVLLRKIRFESMKLFLLLRKQFPRSILVSSFVTSSRGCR